MVKKAAKEKGTAAVVTDKLKRHPLSEKYGPAMTAEEQLGLGLDMKEHGQHEDIILHEGMVLSGWNRYMGGLQQGLQKELRFKELEAGKDPVAVAFGTNFMRRKLSSVQKAFYGAVYAVDTGKKQTDVAKIMACNLNRLNQCVQLIKADTDSSKKAIEKIRDNPELSGGAFDELMIEAGIARTPAPPPPARTGTHADDDGDGLGDGDELDDLTGGAIDDLLGNDGDGDDESPAAAKGKRKEIGEGADPLPLTGKKPASQTNPHETPVSRVAKAFKSLGALEQRQFVKFAWGKLKAALDTAIGEGDVEYVAPEKAPTKADPSLIARGKKPAAGEDDGLLDAKPEKAKGKPKDDVTDVEPKPAAKKAAAKKAAPAAKKAPAKKAAKK